VFSVLKIFENSGTYFQILMLTMVYIFTRTKLRMNLVQKKALHLSNTF